MKFCIKQIAAGFVIASFVASVVMVSQVGGQEFHRREPRGPHMQGFGPPPQRQWEEETSEPTNKGFVFIDGEYLSPPYEVKAGEESVSINGRELKSLLLEVDFGGGRGPGQMRGAGGPNRWRKLAWDLRSQLENRSVILSFAEQPLMILDGSWSAYTLFKTLTEDGNAIRQVSLMDQLPPGFDQDTWRQWVRVFHPPTELRTRTAALIVTYEETERKALASVAAVRRLNSFAFPLTLCGMIASVLAIGHLLGGRPHAGKPTIGQDISPEAISALNWSLLLVVVLSALDLVWTLLAAQAGQMRELNPIGSHLIGDPRHLIGFKIGATLPSIGILWLLRRYKQAQVAAWWICLFVTFLMLRWLSVNSTFVSAT